MGRRIGRRSSLASGIYPVYLMARDAGLRSIRNVSDRL
jgi:hypothetical protein